MFAVMGNDLSKLILKTLNDNFLSSAKYILNNERVFAWESDYLGVTRDMYSYEVEVKINKEDFNRDFDKKADKHAVLSGKEKQYEMDYVTGKIKSFIPNYFLFACVNEDTIRLEDVPPYAGLLYVNPQSGRIRVVRKPPLISNFRFDLESYNLSDRFYREMKMYKDKYFDLKYNGSDSTKKMVAAACGVVRRSAERAFGESCPYSHVDGDNLLCLDPIIIKKFAVGNSCNEKVDCMLQCERGRNFKTNLL